MKVIHPKSILADYYKIHKNGSIKFGLVESAIKYCLPGEDNHGYELHQLIKKDSNAGVSVLCNEIHCRRIIR